MTKEQAVRYLAVFTGGCLGGLARYGVGLLLAPNSLEATLLVNWLGSFLLSFLTYSAAERFDLPDWLILLLGTGLIGAFTTFSTLMGATVPVMRNSAAVLAFGYLALSLIGGLLLALAGMFLAHRMGRRPRV
jgi:CrcB protein